MPDNRKVFFAQILRLLKRCDVAIEVVDARDPQGTRVTKLDRHFRSKVMIVATKADLIRESPRLPAFLEGMPLVYFSSRTREGLEDIFRLIRSWARAKELEEAKVAVFGIPNVGKSSLINVMRGKHSALTGFRVGITRGPQWVKISSGILLLDTAGVVDLKQTREELVLKAAFSVDNLPNPERLALELIEKFLKKKEDSIFKNYKIEKSDDSEKVLESVAKRRGILLKGGEPNIKETAKVVLRDFQKGKFSIQP